MFKSMIEVLCSLEQQTGGTLCPGRGFSTLNAPKPKELEVLRRFVITLSLSHTIKHSHNTCMHKTRMY